jgi:multiple sugar transport system substrate-binding protein
MAATAQRFHELHPEMEIAWSRRSLQEFADKPLDLLAEEFDLLVIDHPCVGFAAKSGALLGLSRYVPVDVMGIHEKESVGASHQSYRLAGEQWALAVDAAAPVSTWRPDLLERHGGAPKDWNELIGLGRKGVIACPSVPLDVYGNFLNLCASLGSNVFPDRERVAEVSVAVTALEMLRELAAVVPRAFFYLDPIRTLETMSQTDEFAYCPFIYGYSNYAREGYAPHRLCFGQSVWAAAGVEPQTMLGGTGLAVSAHSRNKMAAVEYALYVASPEIQRGLYFNSGGQPALRSAWCDPETNRVTDHFFTNTLPAMERAFMRPRYCGYLGFQDKAGPMIHAYLRDGGAAPVVLASLNTLYRDSMETS